MSVNARFVLQVGNDDDTRQHHKNVQVYIRSPQQITYLSQSASSQVQIFLQLLNTRQLRCRSSSRRNNCNRSIHERNVHSRNDNVQLPCSTGTCNVALAVSSLWWKDGRGNCTVLQYHRWRNKRRRDCRRHEQQQEQLLSTTRKGSVVVGLHPITQLGLSSWDSSFPLVSTGTPLATCHTTYTGTVLCYVWKAVKQDARCHRWRCVAAVQIILDFRESKYLLMSGLFEGKIEIGHGTADCRMVM